MSSRHHSVVPVRMSASNTFACADSNRMTISDLLISTENTMLGNRCLIEHGRKKSGPSVELDVEIIASPARHRRTGELGAVIAGQHR